MRYFVVIPAAGMGARMGADIPKQYLQVHNRTILEHTLNCFFFDDRFEKIVVVLHPDDLHWAKLNINHPRLITTVGGGERFHSVFNGLQALDAYANDKDWVLVHDAARPCLQKQDLDKLIDVLKDHPVGGLLGAPVRDTIKRVNKNHEVTETVDRNTLWQAFTPQMFRYRKLCSALQFAIKNKINITDDAAAIELMGEKPVMVAGDPTNIKVTQLADLKLVEKYLA